MKHLALYGYLVVFLMLMVNTYKQASTNEQVAPYRVEIPQLAATLL